MNYIQQAYKGKNSFWRYFISFIVVVIGWQIIGAIPLLITAVVHSKDMTEFREAANENFMSLGINSNLFLFLMILMFAIALAALFFAIKYIHQRSITSLVTSRKNTDWKRVFYAFAIWFSVSIMMIAIGYFSAPETYTWNFKPISFIILVLVSFLFMPLQTSFEELFFRGYLMQGFGILTKNRWFPLLLSSAIFGLMHAFNPEVAKLGYIVMVYYIGTGLLLGILTLMDEGTELSLGFHAANNIAAAIFVTTNWTVFQTDALMIDTSEPSISFETFVPVFVLYPVLLFVFSKKYAWTNWKVKLFGKIEKPNKEVDDFFDGDSMLEL